MSGETERSWADELVAGYPAMMTLHDVSTVLNVEPRQVRRLASHPDPETRITAMKILGVWRFPRAELAAYLESHATPSKADHA